MDWPKLCTTRLLDQNFGMGISPQDIMVPFFNNQTANYFRPWKLCEEIAKKDFGSTIDNTNERLKITLDVQHFLPNEISVKVADNEIIIEGKHEERQDEHGFISREFLRRYALPKHCLPESVTSTLSSDGILAITANKKIEKQIKASEKTVPIQMSGPCRNTEQTKTTAAEVKTEKFEKKESEKCEMSKVTEKCETKKCEKEKDTEKCEMKKDTEKCEMKKDTEKCEMKKDAEKIETKKDIEKDKKECQLMLKEDHCRLLKPELLKDAVKDTEKLILESRKETDELLKLISADKPTVSGTSEKLEEALGQCKTAISELKKEKATESSMAASSETSSISSLMSETIESKESSSSSSSSFVSISSSMQATTEKTAELVNEIIAELKEAAENI